MRSLRATIGRDYYHSASLSVAQFFTQSPFFKDNQHIACYMATPDELDVAPIIKAVQSAGKNCYLPIVDSSLSLRFGLYRGSESLAPNRFGILEPITDIFIEPAQLDVVLLPLIAFDLKGTRLGTGGGYYDCTFAFAKSAVKPALIGVGFEIQEVEALPEEAFDVPLRAILTESGCKLF